MLNTGCSDHICNTILSHLQDYRELILPNVGNTAFTNTKALYNCISRKQSTYFNGFLQVKYPNLSLSFPRITDNRFCSYYVAAANISNHQEVIKEFAKESDIVNFNESEFFGESCQDELTFMSAAAHRFALVFMKDVNLVKTIGSYTELLNSWITKMRESLSSWSSFECLWGLKEVKKNEEYKKLFKKYEKGIKSYLKEFDKVEIDLHKTRFSNSGVFFSSQLENETLKGCVIPFILFVELACEIIYNFKAQLQRVHVPQMDPNTYIKTTNRSGERFFAIANHILERNVNTSAVTIESTIKMRRMLPSFNRIQGALNRFKQRKWFQNYAFKKAAREKLREGNLGQTRVQTYLAKRDQIAKRKRERLVQELCIEIIKKLSGGEIEPSNIIDDGESSYESDNEEICEALKTVANTPKQSSVLFKAKDLKECLCWLLRKTNSNIGLSGKKKEQLIQLFIELANKFLNTSQEEVIYFRGFLFLPNF